MSLTISDAGVDVFISRESRAPTQQGFGINLFLNPVGAIIDRVKTYTSLASVAVDYNAADEPYKAAASFYGQTPTPVTFKVGQVQEGAPSIAAVKASGVQTISGVATSSDNLLFDIDAVTYTVTGVVAEVAGQAAVGSYDISGSGNAAGDGFVGFSLDAVDYKVTPTAADTPTVTGDALAGLVNGGSTHTASNVAGLVTITNVTPGSIGNNVVIADVGTDTTQTGAVLIQPSGGVSPVTGTTGQELATLMSIQITNGATHTASPSLEDMTVIDNVGGIDGNSVVFANPSGPAGITFTVVQPTGGADLVPATPGENLSDALDDIASIDGDFYFVTVAQGINDDPEGDNVAVWTEGNDRMFFSVTEDVLSLDPSDATCQMARFKASGYDRTMVVYSSDPDSYVSCAAAGTLGTTRFQGTNTVKTLKFKDMSGVTIENITTDELQNIKNKNGNVFYQTAGIRMFDQGMVSSGSWADEIHGMDALAEEIRVRVFGLLSRTSTKIPYNERGMSQLEAEVEGALGRFVTNGYLTSRVDQNGDILPAYIVWHIPVIDASPTDKANRIAPDIEFTARLAGAIHEITVNGVLVLD